MIGLVDCAIDIGNPKSKAIFVFRSSTYEKVHRVLFPSLLHDTSNESI